MRIGARIAVALGLALAIAAAWWLSRTREHGGAASAEHRDERTNESRPVEAAGERAESPPSAPEPAQLDSAHIAVRCTLVLVDEASVPLAGALLVALDSSHGVQSGTADAQGRVALEPREGEARLFVRRAAAYLHRCSSPLASGERRLVVPDGAEVSGWITVMGERPDTPIELHLYDDHATFAPGEIPAEVAKLLEIDERGLQSAACTTDAQGAFAFRGLAPTWSGRLALPMRYALRQERRHEYGERFVPLASPARDLRFDLERLPALIGRVVDASGAAPQPITVVECIVAYTENHTPFTGARCDEDGRFEIVLYASNFLGIRLDVNSPSGRLHLERQRAEIADDLDLGELRLLPSYPLTFRALGPDAAPLAGAIGAVGDSRATTDEHGEASIEGLPAGPALLRVASPGLWRAKVDVVLPLAQRLDVRLERGNRLTLSVVDAAGEPVEGVGFGLATGRTPQFPDTEGSHPDSTQKPAMTGAWKTSRGTQETGMTSLLSSEHGRLVVVNLAPNVPIVVTVRGALDTTLLERTLEPLGPSEQRDVVLEIPHEGRTLRGVVRDELGQPLPYVGVTASAEGRSQWQNTAADGSFALLPLLVERLRLGLSKQGFATQVLDVDLAEPLTELAITLQHGRTVAVEVLDAANAGFDGGQLRARDANGRPCGDVTPTTSGHWAIESLPSGSITLAFDVGGRLYELVHDSSVPEARIQVPLHGRGELRWTLNEGQDPFQLCLRIVPKSAELRPTEHGLDARDGSFSSPLLPGDYEVVLARYGEHEEDPVTPVTEPVPLRVTAGATANVTLSLPR